MAKKKKRTKAIARRSPARVVYRKAAPIARRGASAAAKAALTEKHRLIAVGGSALLAALMAKGVKIPHIKSLGIPGSMGVTAYLLAKLTKNQIVSHVATGFLCVGAFQLTAKAMVPKPGAVVQGYEDEEFDPIVIPMDADSEEGEL